MRALRRTTNRDQATAWMKGLMCTIGVAWAEKAEALRSAAQCSPGVALGTFSTRRRTRRRRAQSANQRSYLSTCSGGHLHLPEGKGIAGVALCIYLPLLPDLGVCGARISRVEAVAGVTAATAVTAAAAPGSCGNSASRLAVSTPSLRVMWPAAPELRPRCDGVCMCWSDCTVG